MNKKTIMSFLLALAAMPMFAGNVIPLSGEWRFCTDPSGKAGVDGQWYKKNLETVSDKLILLPGSTDKAGVGRKLKPLSEISASAEKPVAYKGAYWLQKTVDFSKVCSGECLVTGLPEGSVLWWDGGLVEMQDNGWSVSLDKWPHLLTVYVPDPDVLLDSVKIRCEGRDYLMDGVWRLLPALHGKSIQETWLSKGIPSGHDLDLFYETYFRGAKHTRIDFVDLPFRMSSYDAATNLTPSRSITQGLERRFNYDGPFWVQKTVDVPEDWNGSDVEIFIERAPGLTVAYWDGENLGDRHGYDVSKRYLVPQRLLTPGKHSITLYESRSDNDYPQTGHGVKSENGVNWNGIEGLIQLRRLSGLRNIQIYPDVEGNSVKVDFLASRGQVVRFYVRPKGKKSFRFLDECNAESSSCVLNFPYKAALWDEFHPDLYELRCELHEAGKKVGEETVTFGMRSFSAASGGFLMNGKRIFLRGTQHCGAEPINNDTPMGREYWDRIMSITKAWGMNHLRFHSWCPPEAAFAAADEAGIIFQIELPHDDIAGSRKVPGKELERILDEYGNHPSFCMITLGNERFNHNDISRTLIESGRRHDPRHLYACTSHPVDNHCTDDFYISAWGVNDLQPNGWGNPIVGIEWGGGDVVSKSRFNTHSPETESDYRRELDGCRAPVISHEVGQWNTFPYLGTSRKYTGVLENTNYERVTESMREHGLLDKADDFALASGRFSALLYKEEMESAMRTPNLAGYTLLGLNDFQGQHLSVIGVLDEFWDNKGFMTPEFGAMYSRALVPLARMSKRIWNCGEEFKARVEIANYTDAFVKGSVLWSLTDDSGKVVKKEKMARRIIPDGGLTGVGEINCVLTVDKAERLTLTVKVEGTRAENRWSLWVYPKNQEYSQGNVLYFDRWGADVAKALEEGKTVLLNPAKETLRQGYRESCFTPVFWNSIFKWSQKAHTLGILCDPSNPVFASFPTDIHADWQWWDIMMNANAMYMNDLPNEINPLVQVIDSYVFNNKLSYLWECKAGDGRLVVCTVDLAGDLSERPASRQFEKSLYDYMNSPHFHPSVSIDIEMLDKIFIK